MHEETIEISLKIRRHFWSRKVIDKKVKGTIFQEGKAFRNELAGA